MRNLISTDVTSTVVLGSGNYGDRLVVAARGAVEPNAYGAIGILARASLAAAHILNEGTVVGGPGAYAHGTPGVGGIGVDIASAGALVNIGLIEGGQDYGSGYGASGVGGIGVLISSAAQLDNHGTIAGGAGAASPNYYGSGGQGGIGVLLDGNGSQSNFGTILGGAGGNGAPYAPAYGVGGKGGAGLDISGTTHFANAGQITGGAAGVSAGYAQTYGAGDGVDLGGSLDSLSNSGRIAGGAGAAYLRDASLGPVGIGVHFSDQGIVHNSGVILGGAGGTSSLYASNGGIGVLLDSGGTLDNQGSIGGGVGQKTGKHFGATGGNGGAGVISYGSVALSNSGTIYGGLASYHSGGVAVTLINGGSVRNSNTIRGGDSLGKIGGIGVDLANGGTLANSGDIRGGSGISHTAAHGASGAAAVFVHDGTVADRGTILGGSGASGMQGGNGGTGVVLDGGTLTVSGVVAGGAGAYGQSSSGTAGAAVQFQGSGNVLVLAPSASLQGGLAGFASGDTIDLSQVHATSLSYDMGTLTLFSAPAHAVAQLAFDGSYTAADFTLAADGQGGTDILYTQGLAQDFLPASLATSEVRTTAELGAAHAALPHPAAEWALLPQIEHGLMHLLA